MPSATWSMRFFSRPIQTATPIAIALVSATSIQRPTGLVALSRPSEMPLFCGVGEVEDRQQHELVADAG